MKEKKKQELSPVNFKTLKYIIISLIIIAALGAAYCYHFVKEYKKTINNEIDTNNTSINTVK